ncbi:MAG: major facilitator superfamily 1 [Jatrophihabitans sp.]|nr:major facilitator superfamily 1 [Jatrophihabitans sp.]
MAGEHPRPAWVRDHPRAWVAAVVTVCFGAFMGQLDASIVALAYPSIGTDLHAPLSSVAWVSLSYLIALGALLIPVGSAADRYGRKRLYLWGLALFGLASAGCALAPTLGVLIAVRAVQGVGAAMLQANSVALVTTVAPLGRLRLAVGLQTGAQALGLALGPVAGGAVVAALGWRWVFGINVPVALLAFVAGRYLLPRTRRQNAAVRPGLRAVVVLPGLPRRIVGAAIAYLVLFTPVVLGPIMLLHRGYSPLVAGCAVACLPVGFALTGVLGGVARRGSSPIAARFGVATAIVGALLLAALPTGPGYLGLAVAVIGAGLGLYVPANNTQLMASVPSDLAGSAGALVSVARAVGTAAGTAMATAYAGDSSLGALILAAIAAAALLAT